MLHTRARLKGRVEGLGNIARDGFKLLFPYAAGDALWNDPAVTNDDTLALRKIVRNIQSYEDSARVRHKTLASYLNFQLVEIPRRIREGDTKRKAHEGRTKVTLMTMHGAKGLEFPVVYLPAFVEGVIPHERTMKEARELEGNDAKKYEEEERRLAYVAVTRAMDRLHISFPMRMARRGGGQAQEPSRYLREMGLMRSMDTSGLQEE
jgi:superfamily I DNA/RNA helicase